MRLLEIFATNRAELLGLVLEHLFLAGAAVAAALAVGLPLGVAATRRPALRRVALGFANVAQTIPSLALFGFLVPLPFIGGIGARTAIVALALYALLPIVRGTVTGIEGVDPAVRDAGRGMGMTDRQLLLLLELPLAAPVIVAGVRVAAVTSVGIATIAAAVGGGGLGTYVFRGVAMVDDATILAGALPAALLALLVDRLLGVVEGVLRPAGAAGGPGAGSPAAPRRRWMRALVPVAIAGLALAVLPLLAALRPSGPRIVVGSKNFSEQIILAEYVAAAIERRAGVAVERRLNLGGTVVCHEAIASGAIDLYVEYTGTALTAVLGLAPATDAAGVRDRVADEYRRRYGLEWTAAFGFENTFAMIVRGEDARRLGLARFSDLAPHASTFRGGFGYEFTERPDGLPGLLAAYGFALAGPPVTMDLALTYRALADHKVDLIAGNSTDGVLAELDLTVLADDRRYFPPYEAAPIVRADTLAKHPAVRAALDALAGTITEAEMRAMNQKVDGAGADPRVVALDHLRAKGM